MKSRRRRSGDSYEVRRSIEPNRFDNLIGVCDVMLTWSERRDQRHGELRKLNQSAIAETPRLRRLCSDQMNTHEAGSYAIRKECGNSKRFSSPAVFLEAKAKMPIRATRLNNSKYLKRQH
jgi:hypothetical protein